MAKLLVKQLNFVQNQQAGEHLGKPELYNRDVHTHANLSPREFENFILHKVESYLQIRSVLEMVGVT